MADLNIYMLVGNQGSGKTTFRKNHLSFAEVISPDDLLEEKFNYLWTKENVGACWKECYQRMGRILLEATQDTSDHIYNVVLDATFPTPMDRSPILNILKGAGAKVIGVYFDTPYEISKSRNALRLPNRRVPEEILESTRRRMTPPSLGEGFDEIIKVEGGY